MLRKLAIACAACVVVAVSGGAAYADVPGVDTSNWQHPNGASIGWNSVANAGNHFAFLKAVEGSSYTDPNFASDWSQAKAAGEYPGGYDFARPGSGSAVTEARHFVAVLGGRLKGRGTLPPVLDLETSGGLSPSALQSWVQTWLNEVEKDTGRTPMIYTAPYFWQGAMGNSHAFTRYPLWIAEYGVSHPISIGGWSHYTIWQYTSIGSVKGIPGATDQDTFYGSLAQLQQLANDGQEAYNPSGSYTVTRTAAGIVVTGTATDPDTSGPVSVDVTLDGHQMGTVKTNPSTHAFTKTISVSAPGVRTIEVTAENTGRGTGNVSLGKKTITVQTAPVGTVTVLRAPGGVQATGWAVDPDSTAPVTVTVTVDGKPGTPITAKSTSSAAANAMPGYGTGHGFTKLIPLANGTHNVCLTALNLGAGTVNTNLGCFKETITAAPVGAIAPVQEVPGGYRVQGWTINPATTAAQPVTLTVDGQRAASLTAKATGTIPAQWAAYGTGHAFTAVVPARPGKHTVCVAPAATPTQPVACTTATYTQTPIGALDQLQPAAAGATVSGWAIDPDTASPVPVTVTVDGAPAATIASANIKRTDVGRAFPDYGTGHGFTTRIWARGGKHTVCLTAVNPATKKPTTLACKTLTVSSNPVGQVQTWTRVGGAVMFTGWAIDPDSTSPVRIDITVNGKPAGYVIANNTSRTQPYLPLWGTTRTFAGRVSAPAGATITLTAENIGPGTATVLGSRKL